MDLNFDNHPYSEKARSLLVRALVCYFRPGHLVQVTQTNTRFPSSTLFTLFLGGVPLLKPNSRKKGTLIIKGLLGNLEHLQVAPTVCMPAKVAPLF